MALDPMASFEQAQAEADERFYEDREDADAALREANRLRRKALWNARCTSSCPLDLCSCISKCETCGHIRADHDYSGDEIKASWGCCDVDDCTCGRFEVDYDE